MVVSYTAFIMRMIGWTLFGVTCFCGVVLAYGAFLVSRDEKAIARDRRNAGLDEA